MSHSPAIYDLYRVGTPDAAVALVAFLWDEKGDSAIDAAWYLGTLLQKPEVEAKLAEYQLNSKQQPIEEFLYIWQPFDKNPRSSLSVIASRLAYLIIQTPHEKIPAAIQLVDPRIIIPLIAIEATAQIELFEGASPKYRIFWNYYKLNTLSSLREDLQQELVSRLVNYRQPSRYHWRNLFNEVKYNFNTGWHYYTVLVISFILSIVAVVELFTLIRNPNNLMNLLVYPLPLIWFIFCFWLVLWNGLEKRLESSTFMSFGLLGLFTFYRELKQLWHQNKVWTEIEPLYSSLTVAGTVAGAFIGSFAVAGTVAILFVMVGFLAGYGVASWAWVVAFAGVVGVSVTVVVAIAMAFARARAWAVAFAGVFAVAFVVAVVFSWIFPGIGLGAWYRAKKHRDWTRYLAILAFPWFCSFPIVLVYSSYALHDWFDLAWWQVALIWGAILGVCTVLWKRGQQLDYEVRNPLKGILDKVN